MTLLTDITPDELSRLKDDLASGAKHPRQVKEDLAKAMVARYHSRAAADHEAQEFIRVLRERELPEEIEAVTPEGIRSRICGCRGLMVDYRPGGQHLRGPTLNQGWRGPG